MICEAVLPHDAFVRARDHLLRHIPDLQEDLCFATWRPSTGRARHTAIISDVILPAEGDRELHGNVSFSPGYLLRAVRTASERRAGLALMHSHLTPGWQDMSKEDVFAEQERVAPPAGITGLPLVGLTMGTDGSMSARFWFKGKREPAWCKKVRVTGGRTMGVTHNERLTPDYLRDKRLERTIDSWGLDAQKRMARLKVGVVGVGSVGAMVAESLARMGFTSLTLIDPDRVELHNLDRLLYAGAGDVGTSKVRLVERHVRRAATAKGFEVTGLAAGLQTEKAYRSALDCDLLFACVDRPLPKDILNNIAHAHCIPVFFGGVHIATKRGGRLGQAVWTVSRISPGARCLRCDGQYSTSDVVQERDGTLDDPQYIQGAGSGAGRIPNQNVFSFSAGVASRLVNEMVRHLIAEEWWPEPSPKTMYNFVMDDHMRRSGEECRPGCEVKARAAIGDGYRCPFLEPDPPQSTGRWAAVLHRLGVPWGTGR